MQYKNKSIVDIPSAGTKYVPINIHTPYEKKSMAITDIDIIADTSFAKIADDFYLWQEDANAPVADKPVIKLTDSCYKANDLGYDTSIEEVPHTLDASEITSLKGMFAPNFEDLSNKTSEQFENDASDAAVQEMMAAYPLIIYDNLVAAPEMNTSNITDMSYMFGGSAGLLNEDMRSYEYCRVKGCSSLSSVPYYDTQNVQNFSYMFAGCTSLPKVFPWKIDISSVNSGNAAYSLTPMFDGSSVEDVSFVIHDETSSTIEQWLDKKNFKSIHIRYLDFHGGLKKATFSLENGNSESVAYLDDNGLHYL